MDRTHIVEGVVRIAPQREDGSMERTPPPWHKEKMVAYGVGAMFIIEYLSRSPDGTRALHTELALGSTAEEAMDQANNHLPKMSAKYGAIGFRILDADKECVGIGPKGFISPARTP